MLSLEEAIAHCLEVAEKNDKIADTFEETLKNKITCRECAQEHRQLADWLKKLKAYEEAREEIACLPIVWEEGEGIRKCIDILDKHLMEVNADEEGSDAE
jgi:hypothetical protein